MGFKMKKFTGFECGMGIGGWLTNYKRFNSIPNEKRMHLTVGDYEHFESYITEKDIAYIASLGMDHEMPYPCDIERYRDYQRTVWNDNNSYQGYNQMDKEYLYDSLQPAIDFIKKNPDKILWCGEFGTIRHADIKSRENWMRDVISFMKSNDIPYCVWNYLSTPNDGNRFSLTDDDNRKILNKELENIKRGNI